MQSIEELMGQTQSTSNTPLNSVPDERGVPRMGIGSGSSGGYHTLVAESPMDSTMSLGKYRYYHNMYNIVYNNKMPIIR